MIVSCRAPKVVFRATQRAQDKAQAAENGVPLSRTATPYWVLCVTPAGQGDKRPSASLHSLEQDNWSCFRASCIWPLLALLKATFGARQDTCKTAWPTAIGQLNSQLSFLTHQW